MKKRILALALAGTTAFSVFGSALSANAWSWPSSTDTKYDVDAYQSYAPVAQKITATKNTTVATSAYTATNALNGDVISIVGKDGKADYKTSFPSVEDYMKVRYGDTEPEELFTKKTEYTITPTEETSLKENDYQEVTLLLVTGVTSDTGKTFVRVKDTTDWDANGYSAKELGTYYTKATPGAYGSIAGATVYAIDNSNDQLAALKAADSEGITFENYPVPEGEKTTVTFIDSIEGSDKDALEVAGDLENSVKKDDNKNLYTYKGEIYTPEEMFNELKKIGTGYTVENAAPVYLYTLDGQVTATQIAETGWRMLIVNNLISTQADTVIVDSYAFKGTDYSKWTFNSDLTGEVSVEPYTVSTEIDRKGNISVSKEVVPTIYAYDFIPANKNTVATGTIAANWNSGNTAGTANAINDAWDAEKGRGNADWGIRYDVVSDWLDFLEELAIKDKGANTYNENWWEFRSNYLDMFYADPYYDQYTGEQIGTVNVDLYNIEGLLWDIFKLSYEGHDNSGSTFSDGWRSANTSELIYLMQQYDKYIGNYIDKAEVASDEWGDLLLSILDAATESDFRSASEYRKYQNEVEDLRTAYEIATTVNMIHEAEEGMYDLLTSGNSPYRASSSGADKTDLSATLNGLYFNTSSAPTTYKVAPSTTNDLSHVKYTNYNYLVAALSTYSGAIPKWDTMYFTSVLSKGYYSLYPMADYIDDDTTTPNEVYAGNESSKDYFGTWNNRNYATEEYEWFWNVYQLAANMNSSNTKQGSVDAVNDALNDAVSNLAVTTTPNSTEVGAVEDATDKYAGKIDTDYDEGYYDKYEQAYDYAENIAEGKWQTRIAAMIVGVSGEALTYQGTQVTVTKNDMKTLETAIKNGETALEAIKADKDYNAAQVNALNKAIDNAQYIVDLYEGTVTRTDADVQSVNHKATALVGDKDQFVKSDLDNAIEAIDAAINYSEIIMGWSKNDAGKWMYGTDEGYLNDGWHQVDGGKTWFYFNADGTAKQSEWWNDNGTWYWFNSNCGAATGWAKVDGEWYFFKGNNAMKTGWEKVDGNWYYMASSGKMVTGWCEVNGKWYYFSKESNSLGQMLYSTTVDGYKLGADGAWIK